MLRIVRPCRLLSSWSNLVRTSQIRFASISPAIQNNTDMLQKLNAQSMLQKFEAAFLTTKKISQDYFNSLLDSVKDGCSNQQILRLLHLFGEIVSVQSPKLRVEYVNKIWTTANAKGVNLDVSHYNALLKVYVECDYKFSYIRILDQMKNSGIKPNRVTYKYILKTFCKEGDLIGVSRILQQMKDEEIPLNESIFNELIYGHSVAKDFNGAEDVMRIMNEKNIQSTSSTYAAYLQGLALSGNIEKFNIINNKCQEDNISLHNCQLADVIVSLALGGQTSAALEFFKTNKLGSDLNLPELFYKLLHKKQYDLILQISNYFTTDGLDVKGRNTKKLLCKYIANNESVETLMQLIRNWNEEENFMLTVLFYTLKEKELFHKSMDILKEMSRSGHKLKSIYFWPILARAAHENSSEDILKIMQMMKADFGIHFPTTLLENIIFDNMSDPSAEKAVIQGLIAQGESRSYILANFVTSCIKRKDINEIYRTASFIKDEHVNRAINIIVNDEEKNPKRVANFIKSLVVRDLKLSKMSDASDESSSNDVSENILSTPNTVVNNLVTKIVLALKRNETVFLQRLLGDIALLEMPISNETAEVIKEKFSEPEIGIVVDKLVQLPPLDISGLLKKEELKKTTGLSRSDRQIKLLFIKYCKEKMIDKAENLIKEKPQILDEFHPIFFKVLRNTNNEEKIDEYLMKLITKIREGYNKIKFDNILGKELIRKGYVNEALLLYKNSMDGSSSEEIQKLESFISLLDDDSPEKIVKFLNSADRMKISEIVELCVLTGRFDKIVTMLEYLEGYDIRKLKLLHNLIRPLINAGETELLEKCIDILERRFILPKVARYLLFSYAFLGNVTKAQECLRSGKDIYTCLNLIKGITDERHQLQMWENVLNIFVGHKKIINELNVYENLIWLYVKFNTDPEKGLALWERTQDDNIVPSNFFKAYLARLLKTNNMTIPFDDSEYDKQDWLLNANINKGILKKLLDVDHKKDGFVSVMKECIINGEIKLSTIQEMTDSIKEKEDLREMKNNLRHCLFLATYKKAFDEGYLLRHAKEVTNSSQPEDILKSIPHEFLVESILTEKFDRLPNEVSEIIMWAHCSTSSIDPELVKMYEEKVAGFLEDRTIIEGLMKFIPYLVNKEKIINFLSSKKIFFGNMERELYFIKNITNIKNRRRRYRRRNWQDDREELMEDVEEKFFANEANYRKELKENPPPEAVATKETYSKEESNAKSICTGTESV